MKLALVLAGLFTVSMANAKGSKRPTVCMSFVETTMVVDGDSQKVALCQDGKKPVVLIEYTIVTILDEGGVKVPAAVGWK